MAVRILSEAAVPSSLLLLSEHRKWARPTVHEKPGVWAVRLRLNLSEPVRTLAAFEALGDFEFFVDGTSIARSPSDLEPDEAARTHLELDLGAGRHEFFAYLWDAYEGDLPLVFSFITDGHPELLSTASGGWTGALLSNVSFSGGGWGRVHIVGEPTGPNGMDRGAEWQRVSIVDRPADVQWVSSTNLKPIPFGVEAETSPQNEADLSGLPSSFFSGEPIVVSAGDEATYRVRLPNTRAFPRLRASGGEGATIELDISGATDVFLPRGFRQDFASFAPFSGGEATITLQGGERGMALFRLEFLREADDSSA